ncbi:HOOK domain containing protein [Amanita muscaria]
MPDPEHKEFEAFTHFFSTFNLTRPVSSVADISDGTALFELLSIIDSDYFRQSEHASAQSSDSWVLRFAALKRLYRLMTQYFTDVLQKPTSGLDVPDLQALAKDNSVAPALGMCRLTIAIGVQCEKNKEFIGKIQGLSESDQHQLMRAIEQIMVQIVPSTNIPLLKSSRDDHYYMIQTQRSQIFSEKVSVEKAYRALLQEHRTLQSNYDEVISDREETVAQLREMKKEMEIRRNEKSDVILRTEIERLRADLQKSEDNLALAESELDKQTSLATDLTRRVDELQVVADEAARLKDQVDEYRHAADKLQKTENVMEKYKKKLQESADLRQRLKALEKQNASLVDTNASLEEEFRKVAAFKPLMESYKNQIADLETKNTARTQDIENLKFELEQSKAKLRITTEERTKDSATLELYQERVRELELMSQSRPSATKPLRAIASDSTTTGGAEDSGSRDDQWNAEEADMDDQTDLGLGGELDDAIAGTTMTNLKIQIKKLERELDAVRKKEADASRLLVLENLLEDANRMKARYESDYLAAHREKLVLQMNLEEIRSGKSSGDRQGSFYCSFYISDRRLLDSVEAAIALRQRLNETVEQLEALRKEHTELEVKFEAQQKELIVAKSDLTLINKDQLDILATLRESVNEDKVALEADIERLKKLNRELNDKNRMQLEQVNSLLFEKVNLQSEGIGQREKMLLRERDWGDLQSSVSGKELPKDVKSRMLELHEENVTLKEANKSYQEKLLKARQFIKQQDKLFKDQHAASVSVGVFDEGEGGFRAQVKTLESDVARYKTALAEKDRRYRREHELLLSAIHTQGMRTMRQHVVSQAQYPRTDSSSWLNTQRKMAMCFGDSDCG